MKLGIRSKIAIGLLSVLLVGTAGSVAVVVMLKRSVSQLQHVIDRDDVVAIKAVEIRLAMLEMSDAMRGYLLDPTNQAEFDRKMAADSAMGTHITELKNAGPSADLVKMVDQAQAYDETTLNKLEDDILTLIKSGKTADARAQYDGQYIPARA